MDNTFITKRVSFKLQHNGSNLQAEPDGFIGQLTPGKLLIEICVESGRDYIYGIQVDGRKMITYKHNHSESADKVILKTVILIKTGLDGVFHTEYPENNLRIIRIYKNGHMELWEMSVVAQNNNFFLRSQKVYDVQCYNNDGKLDCPRFSKWPDMLTLLKTNLLVKNLPDISEYKEDKMVRPGELSNNIGHVQWYNEAQGFGSIMTSSGPARIHWKNIFPSNGNRFATLAAGEKVQYGELRKPNQTKARHTNFRQEAYGVKIINA